MKKEIDEVIADAMAQEEAEKSIKEAIESAAKEEIEKSIKDEVISDKISIELAEYVELKQRAADFERILSVILDECKLSYNEEYLIINDSEKITAALKVLYPETYREYYRALKARAEHLRALERAEG